MKRQEQLHPGEQRYAPPAYVDIDDEGVIRPGGWRADAELDLPVFTGDVHGTADGTKIRDTLRDYFMTPPGEVHWQLEHVRRVR